MYNNIRIEVCDMSYASKQYLTWLVVHADKEEFQNELLAIIDRELNEETLEEIKNAIYEEISVLDELISISGKDVDYNDLLNSKQILFEKIDILTKILQDYESKKIYEANLEEFGCSGVLFATNNYGNFMVEGDLKKLKSSSENSVYLDAIDLINRLCEGFSEFNEDKQKPVGSDNKSIKGIYELKNFQLRLLYRYVVGYKVVIGVYLKKTTLDNKYRQFVVNVKYQSQQFCDMIEKQQIDINSIIGESIEFYETLINQERNV